METWFKTAFFGTFWGFQNTELQINVMLYVINRTMPGGHETKGSKKLLEDTLLQQFLSGCVA